MIKINSECQCGSRPFFPAKVKSKVGEFERIISFRPGFKCTKTGPNSHGRHCADLIFILKGVAGAIQFLIFTGWEEDSSIISSSSGPFISPNDKHMRVMPADIGCHSLMPLYDGQKPVDQKCPWVDYQPCYYDGSSLQAEEVYKILVKAGEEAMWSNMEDYYKSWLLEKKEA